MQYQVPQKEAFFKFRKKDKKRCDDCFGSMIFRGTEAL